MDRSIARVLCCLGLLALEPGALAADGPSGTSTNGDTSTLCTAAILLAQRRYAIPPGLLDSIAKVESGRPMGSPASIRPWPWTIDADGTASFFFDTKAQAVSWLREAERNGGHSLDIGCMQVNLQMHPHAFATPDIAFDPAANADYAARYLRQLHDEANGDWNVAVGLYHSHTPYLAADYRERVALVGAGIVTGIGGPLPLYLRVMRRGTVRIALAGGGVLLLNTARQPHGLRAPDQSPCEVAAIMTPLLSSRPSVAGCSRRFVIR